MYKISIKTIKEQKRSKVRPVTSDNLRLSRFKHFTQSRHGSSKSSGENIATDSCLPKEFKESKHESELFQSIQYDSLIIESFK